MDTKYQTSFKKEYRQLTRSFNKNGKNKQLNKFEGISNMGIPSVKIELHKNLFINAITDSGASHNILSLELFESLNKMGLVYNIKPWSGKILAANNSDIPIKCKCLIKIKISKFSWKVPFLVTNEFCGQVILGVPFLCKTQMVLDLNNKICHFRFKPKLNIKLYFETNNKNDYVKTLCSHMDIDYEAEKLIAKYPEVFTDKIGKAIDLEVSITLLDHTPVNIRPYMLAPPTAQKVQKIVDEWLKEGIIEPSMSNYSSPAFLTDRGRLVVNYSELNKKILKVNFPLGNLLNFHQYLCNAKYFTVLDLNKSFLQCPLAKESQHLTAFSLMSSKYSFVRVPFGLQIGSSVLSAYLDKLFAHLRFKCLINYCDDLIIYDLDAENHLKHVTEVLDTLSKNGLTVNLSKTRMFCTQISFLGNLISNNKVTIDPDRTKNVLNFKAPRTVKQVQQFLGCTGFFARYIKNYAELCRPLNNLKRKNTKFYWSELCQKNFELLKKAISEPPVLQIANFEKPFVLMCDASMHCSGSCLMQENDQGDLLPISYHSKKFTDAELKYSIYEKESLSILQALDKFEEFLEVQPFKLITDNEALSYVLNTKRKFGRLSRWVEKLLRLPFTVEFKRSKENCVADALSRLYSESDEPEELCGDQNVNQLKLNDPSQQMRQNPIDCQPVIKTITNKVNKHDPKFSINFIKDIPLAYDSISSHQLNDPDCIKIMDSIKNRTNNLCYSIKNDVLLFKKQNKTRIYLPQGLISLIFQYYHSSLTGGHFGYAKTLAKINEHFYRINLNNEIKARINSCHECLLSKTMFRKYEGKLISEPVTTAMNTLYIDLVGPLIKSKKQNTYLLVCVDACTKYVWLYGIRNCTSNLIITKLDNLFCNFGMPRILVSDNASYFVSSMFKQYCFKNGIRQRNITPYRAASNISERYIRDITVLLRAFYNDKQNMWDNDLGSIQLSLNNSKNSSTGNTAFNLMYGHPCNLALSNLWNIHDLLSTKITLADRKKNLSNAIQNLKKAVNFNRNRTKYQHPNCQHPYKLGSLVYIKTHYLSNKAKQFSSKLAPKFIGPYKIIHFLSDVSVIVQNQANLEDTRRCHIIDLKLVRNN